MLSEIPGLNFRRLNDEGGDAGPFIIMILDNEAKAETVLKKMIDSGLHNAFRICNYGLHIYYNIPSLINKVPLSPAGNPWNLAANAASRYDYAKGACPISDQLFACSILLPIPSKLTLEQEKDAADIIKAAVNDSLKVG